MLACSPDTDREIFKREFTENCFAVFDQSSCVIAHVVLPILFFPREFHVAISWMDLSKIFDKTIGGGGG